MNGDDDLTEVEQDELSKLLADAAEDMDPVPPSAIRFAMESRRLVAFEAELAEIVSDSFVESAAMRSAGDVRSAVFRSGDVTIALEVDAGQIVGSVEPPPNAAVLTMQHSADVADVEVAVNDRGFFSFGPVEGRVRLHLSGADRAMVTDWIQI